MIDESIVLEVLKNVIDEDLDRNVVDLGYIKKLIIKDNIVTISLEFADKKHAMRKYILKSKCKNVVEKISGVKKVDVIMTTRCSGDKSYLRDKISIPRVKNTILISSGKGGVGKSTVALHISLSLARMGKRIALVDADIYGPSIPYLLDIVKVRPLVNNNNNMLPIEKYGIKTMSIGYLIDDDKAIIWRGPMIMKALYSMLISTEWGDIDYLIIDMPPGTGDTYISIAEKFIITGAVIVSLPQNLSCIDAVKSYDFFTKTNIPVIGFIENMSYLMVEEKINYIFGKSSVKKLTESLESTFLGEIPLDSQICAACEKGSPLLLNERLLSIYDEISKKILDKCL